MPYMLRNLRVKRVDLVDRGANLDVETEDGAHVRLFKQADEAAVVCLYKRVTWPDVIEQLDRLAPRVEALRARIGHRNTTTTKEEKMSDFMTETPPELWTQGQGADELEAAIAKRVAKGDLAPGMSLSDAIYVEVMSPIAKKLYEAGKAETIEQAHGLAADSDPVYNAAYMLYSGPFSKRPVREALDEIAALRKELGI